MPAAWMKRDEVIPTVPRPHTLGHRGDDRAVLVALHFAIATQNPNDRLVLVSLTQKLPVGAGILSRKDAALPDRLEPLVSPRRQHADIQVQLLGTIHDPVHVLEVLIVRLRWIVVRQR